ncbi:MAG: NAD(P)/FAD-dependent oxidoreductase [Hyphomicrobiaceae bacterium]
MSLSDLAQAWDVIVVGAGPAGMAAATVTANAGLRTLVLDENTSVGGQIWRAITRTPVLSRPVLGRDYWSGQAIVDAFAACGATHVAGATVWSLDRHREIGVSQGGAARMLTARRVIIATGAMERPFPVPGWTLPGVMTIGGAQTALKSSGLVPQGRVVLAGCGPLLWLYADQILRAGGKIQAILDTSDAGQRRQALRHAATFARSPYLLKGLKLMASVRRKVRVVSRVTQLAIEGTDRAEAICYRCGVAMGDRMPADLVLLHQGVVPNPNLAMAAGVEHHWSDAQLCFVPKLDAWGTTSIDGIAIAGDGAGVAGVEAAVERGRLAGLAAATALGAAGDKLPDAGPMRRQLARYEAPRAFLDVLYRPSEPMRIPSGDTIVCRCEEVTAAQVIETVAIGPEGPNQMKSFLRCGMGPCQGRLCGLTVTELIAKARSVSPESAGYYRLRPPVKPITLAEIASLETQEHEVKAVARS